MSKTSKKVRVAIIGVGNCACSLVQGVEYYKNAADDTEIPGLMHANLGGYHVRDIEFSAAFDVVSTKVGLDLSEAIWAFPNNTIKFTDVPKLDVPVYRGMTHDGLGKYLNQVVEKAPGPTDDIIKILKETKTDVVVNFMPVGSEMATKWYVEQILDAGCAFVNGIPVFIASSEYWGTRFKEHGLPVIGDDVKSQVGATIVHRVLTNLFLERGVHLDHTYQLNFGGNMDFYNMLERERLESKKISKTKAVTSQLPYDMGKENGQTIVTHEHAIWRDKIYVTVDVPGGPGPAISVVDVSDRTKPTLLTVYRLPDEPNTVKGVAHAQHQPG